MRLEEKLVFLRKRKSLSQEKVGEAVGASRQSVYKWESGAVVPGMEYLIRLSQLYGLTLDDLVNESVDLQSRPEEKPKPPEEPYITEPKKPRLSPLKKRVIVLLCILAAAAAICWGGYSLRIWEEERNIVPIEELEGRRLDIPKSGEFTLAPLEP